MLARLRILRVWGSLFSVLVLFALIGFLLICGLPVLTVVLNWARIGVVVKQAATAKFPTVHGVVVRSEMVTAHGNDNGMRIEYAYEVRGHRYVCDRVSEEGLRGEFPGQFVRRHAVGSKVLVHYRPDDPAHAVLYAGVAGSDLLGPLFLVPLHIFSLWILGFVARGIYNLVAAPEPGVRIRFDGLVKRVRIPSLPTASQVALEYMLFPLMPAAVIFVVLLTYLDRYQLVGFSVALVCEIVTITISGCAFLKRAWPI